MAAASFASASRMSGRWVSSSDGRPGVTRGTATELSEPPRICTRSGERAMSTASVLRYSTCFISGNSAETYAREYLASTVPSAIGAEITHLDIDTSTSTVAIAAAGHIDTSFLAMIGVESLTLTAAASAGMGQAGSGKDLEVAMMLDITGSMAGHQIADLKFSGEDPWQELLTDG